MTGRPGRSAGDPLRVVLDATPLLGQLTGIGRYTAELMAALAGLPEGERPDQILAAAFTWRGHQDLAGRLPAGVVPAGRRAPARLLQACWKCAPVPTMPMLGVRADVVHGTNFVLPPPGRRAAGVVSVHDLSFLRVPDTVSTASARYRHLVPQSLRHASLILTLTEAVADEIVEEYRLPRERVRAIHLGVDPSWFDAGLLPRHPGLPERYLLFVGTLEPRKDVAGLLAAFRQLRRQEPDTPPLVLVGPAGWGPALDTAELAPEDVIELGYLDAVALRSVVAHAAVLCFPSLYEGFGLPPLEALAAGVPVIATDIPPLREVLGDAGPGVRLVAVRDPDALSSAISAILTTRPDPAPGRAHARRFTWSKTAALTAKSYRDALAMP